MNNRGWPHQTISFYFKPFKPIGTHILLWKSPTRPGPDYVLRNKLFWTPNYAQMPKTKHSWVWVVPIWAQASTANQTQLCFIWGIWAQFRIFIFFSNTLIEWNFCINETFYWFLILFLLPDFLIGNWQYLLSIPSHGYVVTMFDDEYSKWQITCVNQLTM